MYLPKIRNAALPLLGLAALLSLPVYAEAPATTDKASIAAKPAEALAVTTTGFTPVAQHKKLRVALYQGPGASTKRDNVMIALEKDKDLTVVGVTPDDIRAGKLANFDVIVQPGGSGGGQGNALGEEGRKQEREFVHKGGGYIGICGGSYLATCDYKWSLNILNAHVLDKAHWARGHGPVEVSPTATGKDELGAPLDKMTIIYWQGPILAPAEDTTLPAYTEWAKFDGEVHRDGVPGGVMPGKTAVAAADFGSGRVVCFSPHPEKTEGQEGMLHHAILWVTKNDATGTVRP